MIEIIHNPNRAKITFTCGECGCVFKTDEWSLSHKGRGIRDDLVFHKCPICKYGVYRNGYE